MKEREEKGHRTQLRHDITSIAYSSHHHPTLEAMSEKIHDAAVGQAEMFADLRSITLTIVLNSTGLGYTPTPRYYALLEGGHVISARRIMWLMYRSQTGIDLDTGEKVPPEEYRPPDESYQIDTSGFVLRIHYGSPHVRGLGRHNSTRHVHKYYTSASHKSGGTECLLVEVKAELGITSQFPTMRKQCGIKHQGGISLDELSRIEERYDIDISVYADDIKIIGRNIQDEPDEQHYRCHVTWEPVMLYPKEPRAARRSRTIDLMLKDEHYSTIKFYPQFCPETGELSPRTPDGSKWTTYDRNVVIGKLYEQGRYKVVDGVGQKLLRKYLIDTLGKTPAQADEVIEQVRVPEERRPAVEYADMFWDTETVVDFRHQAILRPYSLSWWVPSEEPEPTLVVGWDCIDQLAKRLKKAPPGRKYRLIGYNSSRFDNFLLARYGLEMDIVDQIRFAGNSILEMRLKGHKVWDLCRYLSCSLKKACDDFKTEPRKLEGYDHSEIQARYMSWSEGERDYRFIEEMRVDPLLASYNKTDVAALKSLYDKTKQVVLDALAGSALDFALKPAGKRGRGKRFEIQPISKREITSYSTIGQMSYALFQATNAQAGIVTPNASERSVYDWVRRSMMAGRCQRFRAFNKWGKPGDLRMVDVASLYPYVMLNREYPVGEPEETDDEMEGKLGIYDCEVEEIPGKINIRAKRGADSALDWEFKGRMKATLTNVEIALYRKQGRNISVGRGIYWAESSRDVFECQKSWERVKTEQDVYRRFKDERYERYIPALREMCKMFLNSLSGKMCQRIYESETAIVQTEKDFDAFYEHHDQVVIIDTPGGKSVLRGLRKRTDDTPDSAKPCQLAVFIYAYSRCYMYETALQYNPIYTDTDSAALELADYDRLREEHPELFHPDKPFGTLEEETGGKCSGGIFVTKKMYYMANEVPEKVKCKIKGIRPTDKWLTKEEYDKCVGMSEEERYRVYKDREGWMKDPRPLFEQLWAAHKAYFLCSQIRRVITERNTDGTLLSTVMKQAYLPKVLEVGEMGE